MHPKIIKAGDAKKNIIVYFSMRKCQISSCKIMSDRVSAIKKQGYIVYKFYQEDHDGYSQRVNPFGRRTIKNKFFREHNITHVPAILIFNEGKVVQRYVGLTEIADIIRGVKKTDHSPYNVK